MSIDVNLWKEVTVTPSDATVITPPLRGLICLDVGSLQYRPYGGSARTITVPYAGFFLPSYIDMVYDTSTDMTASQLIAGR